MDDRLSGGCAGVAHNMYTHMCIKLSENYFFHPLCPNGIRKLSACSRWSPLRVDSHNMRIIMSFFGRRGWNLKLCRAEFKVCCGLASLHMGISSNIHRRENNFPRTQTIVRSADGIISQSLHLFSTPPAVITILTSIKCFIHDSRVLA